MNSYREAIEQFGFYIATPIGRSMLPLIRARVDTVKLVKPENLKKYDIILYERANGKFVLHRIVKIKEKGYVLCGDNQGILEYPIVPEQIIGKVEGIYRKERYISCDNKGYLFYVHLHAFFRPLRYIIEKTKFFLIGVKHSLKKKREK